MTDESNIYRICRKFSGMTQERFAEAIGVSVEAVAQYERGIIMPADEIVLRIHYVDEQRVSVIKNADPIFKEFQLSVNGSTYNPWNFLRILRNTKDGAAGIPITQENSRLISVSYQQLMLEYSMAKRGGNKKGFLKSEKPLAEPFLTALKEAWKNLYANEKENVIVLNNGVEFQECSDTSAEMQLDENKRTNAGEFAKIFHISPEAISGKSEDINSLAKLAAIPLMKCIECALNRDLLLEAEKKQYYFAYDTKELLKGEMRERFEAYKTALDANFMQIDEVRYAEDLEPLGLTWIKLGLQDVLYDPKTKQIYTPNTNQTSAVGPAASAPEDADEDAPEAAKTAESLNSDEENGIIESRADGSDDAEWIKGPDGKFQGRRPSKKANAKKKNTTDNKYSPSPRRNSSGINLSPKKYSKLCGIMGTQHPNTKKGQKVSFRDNTHTYFVTADGYGGFILNRRISNNTKRKK